MYAERGYELTLDEYVEHHMRGNRGAWHLLGLTDDDIAVMRKRRNAIYSASLRTEPIEVAGARDVLVALQGRVAMGVVTSSRRDHFELIHSRTGFTEYVDFVLALGDYPRSKPNPDPYLAALELSGSQAERCVVIEDSERGLRAAKAAGLACWVIPTDLTEHGDFGAADRVLASIAEVPDLLAG